MLRGAWRARVNPMHSVGELPAEQQFVEIWKALEAGVGSARHPFHTGVLATVGSHSGEAEAAEARTVVVRGVYPGRASVLVHSHRDSSKIAEVDRYPGASLLLYDSEGKWQLRLKGRARVHHADGLTAGRWEAVSRDSRACYHAPLAPGTPIPAASHSSETHSSRELSEKQAYESFAVIELELTEIETLFLDHRGHRRWKWDLTGEHPQSQELAP